MLKNKIEDFLKHNKMSIAELERRCGLKSSVIKNILHNRSKNPSINTVISISKGLNCKVTDLLNLGNDLDADKENYLNLFIQCLQVVLNYYKNKSIYEDEDFIIKESKKLLHLCNTENISPETNTIFKINETSISEDANQAISMEFEI